MGTLSEFSERSELIGWIPGNESFDTGAVAEEMTRLNKENAQLTSEISTLQSQLASQAKKAGKPVTAKKPSRSPEDIVILLRAYLDIQGPRGYGAKKPISYAQADESLSFSSGTTKKYLAKALVNTELVISQQGDSVVELRHT